MHQDHNCTLIWQAPQAYSSWLNYEDLSPGIPNELQTLCLRISPKWLIFQINPNFGNSYSYFFSGENDPFLRHWSLEHDFQAKGGKWPWSHFCWVEFRKTVVRSTHPLYKCATTYLHTLHTAAKLNFCVEKSNL